MGRPPELAHLMAISKRKTASQPKSELYFFEYCVPTFGTAKLKKGDAGRRIFVCSEKMDTFHIASVLPAQRCGDLSRVIF